HVITYTVTVNGCTDSKTANLTVKAAPVVSLAAFSDVFVNAAACGVRGALPAGGSYSGTGVSAGSFDPAVAGVGTHVITYTVTVNGCTDSKTANLTVKAAPVVSLAAFSDVCVNAAAFALSGGLPAGGSYSGTGVSAGSFDPA